MKKVLIFLSLLLLISPAYAHDVSWPKTKYNISDCITPTDTTWSWYGKTALVEDVVLSKYLNGFAYQLRIYGLNRQQSNKFSINSIDNYTAEVTPCPN